MSQTAPTQNPRRTEASILRSSERAKQGWSPERRAKQSAMMRARKIWLKSTGPRTAAGKARSAQNAAKPWLLNHPDKVIEKARRAQVRYITEINRFIGLKKIYWQNELLKREIRNRQRRLVRLGRKVTMELLVASTYYRLCKNLDFWPRVPVKVNAPPARLDAKRLMARAQNDNR